MKHSILVIEDDPDIRTLIAHRLAKEGYEVIPAASGEEGLALAREHCPSLVLLDLMLPGIQGLDVCRILKQQKGTRRVPVMMLTAKGEESDIVLGLEMGADDYLTKPFGSRELIARIRALLRRLDSTTSEPEGDALLTVGDVTLDPSRHEVRVGGEPVVLTLSEFKLLQALLENKGRVLTREQLLSRITDSGTHIVDRNVDVHIRGIRKRIGAKAIPIETIRGIGYKLREK